jgi:hypothetical protein
MFICCPTIYDMTMLALVSYFVYPDSILTMLLYYMHIGRKSCVHNYIHQYGVDIVLLYSQCIMVIQSEVNHPTWDHVIGTHLGRVRGQPIQSGVRYCRCFCSTSYVDTAVCGGHRANSACTILTPAQHTCTL